MLVIQFDAKHRSRENYRDNPFDFDMCFFRSIHAHTFLPSSKEIRARGRFGPNLMMKESETRFSEPRRLHLFEISSVRLRD